MEWWQTIPSAVWELPMQVLVIVLLSLGVFVTKREHANMTKMMEYFRTISENREQTIKNQAEALTVLANEIAPLLRDTLGGIRHVANEKREDNVQQKE